MQVPRFDPMRLVMIGKCVRFVHGQLFPSWPIWCLGETGETDSGSENAGITAYKILAEI